MSQASRVRKFAGEVASSNLVGGVETITGAGGSNALSPSVAVSVLVTSGGTAALSLPVAPAGTIKLIVMKTAGNDATMTAGNGNVLVATSIVWNAAGEAVTLVSDGAKWHVAGVNGATIS